MFMHFLNARLYDIFLGVFLEFLDHQCIFWKIRALTIIIRTLNAICVL